MKDEKNFFVVVDNGTGSMKAGFSKDKYPQTIFPTMIGRVKDEENLNQKEITTKEKLENLQLKKNRSLKIETPFNNEIINWEVMEKIWDHLFEKELKISLEEHPILFTDINVNIDKEKIKFQREKICEIIFESFHVNLFYIQNQTVLSLYHSGKQSGTLLNCGENFCCSVPIYEGNAFYKSAYKNIIGGNHLTQFLSKTLTELEIPMFSAEWEVINDIKEKMCYVSLDFEEDMFKSFNSEETNKIYELPDGRIITLSNERFKCSEALFQPDITGTDSTGIHDVVYSSIMRTDFDIRSCFYNNVILSGGSPMFPGLEERLKIELISLAPSRTKVNVLSSPQRNVSSWIGGSMITSISNFERECCSKEEYLEKGGKWIHKKCF